MTTRKLYSEFSSLLTAIRNCEKSGNSLWRTKHGESIDVLSEFLPSGSGIDTGTKFDLDASKPNRLVFYFSFHHMNEGGMYDGWTDHTLVVTPSLASGYDLRITGRNRNDIKDYLYDTFGYALGSEVWQTEDSVWHSSLQELER